MSQVKLKLTLLRLDDRTQRVPPLNIRCNIQGAKILLNGEDTGKTTNTRLIKWTAGTYSVEKPGYVFIPASITETDLPPSERTIDFIGIAQVKTPVIALDDSAPFETEQTIEFGDITCETSGATIWVSLDEGATWHKWSELDQVATPEIALDDSVEYSEQQTIKFEDIRCDTEGAAIFVSLDEGDTWEEWEDEGLPPEEGIFDETFDDTFE